VTADALSQHLQKVLCRPLSDVNSNFTSSSSVKFLDFGSDFTSAANIQQSLQDLDVKRVSLASSDVASKQQHQLTNVCTLNKFNNSKDTSLSNTRVSPTIPLIDNVENLNLIPVHFAMRLSPTGTDIPLIPVKDQPNFSSTNEQCVTSSDGMLFSHLASRYHTVHPYSALHISDQYHPIAQEQCLVSAMNNTGTWSYNPIMNHRNYKTNSCSESFYDCRRKLGNKMNNLRVGLLNKEAVLSGAARQGCTSKQNKTSKQCHAGLTCNGQSLVGIVDKINASDHLVSKSEYLVWRPWDKMM